jgi:hypothetical protein
VTPAHTFTRRDRVVLGFLIAIAAGIIGWLLLRPTPPPEPVVKGHPLSWWIARDRFVGSARLSREDLRPIGPGGVRWLTFTAKNGDMGRRTPTTWLGRQWDTAVEWIRLRRTTDPLLIDPHEGKGAMMFLRILGPDAAPAVPTMVRIVERVDEPNFRENPRAFEAARVLVSIGPPAYPEYLRLLATRPPKTREQLLIILATELDPEVLSEAGSVQLLDALLAASRHPDPIVHFAALFNIAGLCHHHGFQPAMKPALEASIKIFADRAGAERSFLLGAYGKEAAAAIPLLVTQLDDSNPNIADSAALALAMIDPADKRVIPRMRSMLSSPDIGEREIARDTLEAFGELPAHPAPQP